jgi:hypothetical protein
MSDNLTKQVKSIWTQRGTQDKRILEVLDQCVHQLAGEANNWDPLARFLALATAHNAADGSRCKAIVRAAFGDQITYKVDKNHACGGRITPKQGLTFNDVNINMNTYSVVHEAVHGEIRKGFRDAAMHKAIREQEGKVKADPKPKELDALAKHVAKYLTGRMPEGVTIEMLMKAVTTEMATKVVGEPAF